jgi:hypothetical protein
MLGSSLFRLVCKAGGSSVSMSVVGSRVFLAKPAVSSVVMIYDCTKIVKANSADLSSADYSRCRNCEGGSRNGGQGDDVAGGGYASIRGGGGKHSGGGGVQGGCIREEGIWNIPRSI